MGIFRGFYDVTKAGVGTAVRVATLPIRHPIKTLLIAGGIWAADKGLPVVNDHWKEVFGNDPPQVMLDIAKGFGFAWETTAGVGRLVYDKGIVPTENAFNGLIGSIDAYKAQPEVPAEKQKPIDDILHSALVDADRLPSAANNKAIAALAGIGTDPLKKFAEALNKTPASDITAKSGDGRTQLIAKQIGEAAKTAGLDKDALGKVADALQALGESESSATDPTIGQPLWLAASVVHDLASDPTKSTDELLNANTEKAKAAYTTWKTAHDNKTSAPATPEQTAPKEEAAKFWDEDGKKGVVSRWAAIANTEEPLADKLRPGETMEFSGLQADGTNQFVVAIQRNQDNTYSIMAGPSKDGKNFDGIPKSQTVASLDEVFQRLRHGTEMNGHQVGPAENLQNYLASYRAPSPQLAANNNSGRPIYYYQQQYPTRQPTAFEGISNGLGNVVGGVLSLPGEIIGGVIHGVGSLFGAQPSSPGYMATSGAAAYQPPANTVNPYANAYDVSKRLNLGAGWTGGVSTVSFPLEPTSQSPNGSNFTAHRWGRDNYTVVLDRYGQHRGSLSVSANDERMHDYLDIYTGRAPGTGGSEGLEQAVVGDWMRDPRNTAGPQPSTPPRHGDLAGMKAAAGSDYEHLTTAQLNDRAAIAARNAVLSARVGV